MNDDISNDVQAGRHECSTSTSSTVKLVMQTAVLHTTLTSTHDHDGRDILHSTSSELGEENGTKGRMRKLPTRNASVLLGTLLQHGCWCCYHQSITRNALAQVTKHILRIPPSQIVGISRTRPSTILVRTAQAGDMAKHERLLGSVGFSSRLQFENSPKHRPEAECKNKTCPFLPSTTSFHPLTCRPSVPVKLPCSRGRDACSRQAAPEPKGFRESAEHWGWLARATIGCYKST